MFTNCSKIIEIDAGHRVTNHNGKCSNLHGHRYKIEVAITGPLVKEGSSEGMVLDFSGLKQVMEGVISSECDHAFIAWVKDIEVLRAYWASDAQIVTFGEYLRMLQEEVGTYGFAHRKHGLGQLYVIGSVPTAENLARHWGERLQDCWNESRAPFNLVRISVQETPTSTAEVYF